jgi:hypothetical protein
LIETMDKLAHRIPRRLFTLLAQACWSDFLTLRDPQPERATYDDTV